MKIQVFTLFLAIIFSSCNQVSNSAEQSTDDNYDIEKEEILEALLNETKDAFARDYEAWQANWVHRSSISKTYMNFADTTFSEMTSWKEVDDFVRTYIEDNPEPVPPPAQPDNVSVKLYGSGAWVSYEIVDEVFGNKREARLMEKEDGRWKIAGMHTTIYGFENQKN